MCAKAMQLLGVAVLGVAFCQESVLLKCDSCYWESYFVESLAVEVGVLLLGVLLLKWESCFLKSYFVKSRVVKVGVLLLGVEFC